MALFGRPSQKEEARSVAFRDWFLRQNPLAIAALIFSAFSFTHFGTLWLDEIIGIVLGVVALSQLNRSRAGSNEEPPQSPQEGRRFAWGGIVVGLASLCSAVIIYFFMKR